jgi:hypothetical protein
MDDMLSLGTEVAPWQIKDFSVSLRQQITQAARRQDCTLAEWLHGYFQRHGIDGQQFAPVNLAPVGPDQMNGSNGATGTIDDLCRLVEAAAKLAEVRDKMPRNLAGLLSRRLRDALSTPEELARPRQIPPKQIAGPQAPDAAA